MGKKSRQKTIKKIEPPNTAQNKIHQVTQVHEAFSGPLPHPKILADYDKILPGTAERIITLAEAEAEHRRLLEKTAINAEVEEKRRGQKYGLIIGCTGIGASVLLGAMGTLMPAAVIGGGTVVSLVTVFVIGRVVKPKDKK